MSEAKGLKNNDRLTLIERLRSTTDRPPLKYRQLTLQELKIMEGNGIAIANHSHTHPMLDKLDAPEIAEELAQSTAFLKKNGFPFYDVFAYPNGNHTMDSEKILRDHKLKMAFLFDHKLQVKYENPYRISRLSVNDYTPLWKYEFILSGWHSRILPLTRAIKKMLPI